MDEKNKYESHYCSNDMSVQDMHTSRDRVDWDCPEAGGGSRTLAANRPVGSF
jgi:hypothetical protein